MDSDYTTRRIVALIYNLLFIVQLHIASLLAGLFVAAIFVALFRISMAGFMIIYLYASPLIVIILFSLFFCNGRPTPGHKYMGLAIVDQEGKALPFLKTLLRNFLWLLSVTPFGLGVIWAFFGSAHQGWHDLLIKTKVVSKEDVKLPVLPLIAFLLPAIAFFLLLVMFAVLFGLTSLTQVLVFSIAGSIAANLLGFFIGIVARFITKKTEELKAARKSIHHGLALFILNGFLTIIIFAAVPSNSLIYYQMQEEKCEKEIMSIADAVMDYERVHDGLPVTLAGIVDSHILHTARDSLVYLYSVRMTDGHQYFIIERRIPDGLYKGRGILPPRPCKSIKYIQGKGLEVKIN